MKNRFLFVIILLFCVFSKGVFQERLTIYSPKGARDVINDTLKNAVADKVYTMVYENFRDIFYPIHQVDFQSNGDNTGYAFYSKIQRFDETTLFLSAEIINEETQAVLSTARKTVDISDEEHISTKIENAFVEMVVMMMGRYKRSLRNNANF